MSESAHTLTVQSGGTTTTLAVAPGLSVREALDATSLRVRAACGGTGSCGACTVRYVAGSASPPTVAEYTKLTAEERAEGIRLACQLRLDGDMEILLEHPAPPSPWKSIAPEDLLTIDARLSDLQAHIYGVAVDLGTTHIRVSLWDRKHGQRIATRCGPNPQASFGADVLNRLAAARKPEHARELARLARDAVIEAIHDMLARDVGEVTPMMAEIGHVVIAGNTAMLALLTGRGGEDLLDPENWQRAIDCVPGDDPDWQAAWHLPNARIEVLPPVAGFVGSDLIADFVATGFTEGPPGALLIDVGTNIEIALWDGKTVHVTSVPGGPAFESGGVAFGMPAEPGAICAVRRSDAGFDLDVIGGGEARGYCGSGLLDAVAAMLEVGILKPSGRFAIPCPAEGYRLDPANPRTAITGNAVDAFQRAKAAMAAAIRVLLAEAGMQRDRIGRLFVCGAFGRQLNGGHARAAGLLPPLPMARQWLFGDATLGGCEALLLRPETKPALTQLANCLRFINVTLVIWYEDAYIEELRLREVPAAE
ncbi:MAG: DUF4445 domain-containing protein [Rhodocyclales bacterium]|nr:DUF4445 domain-containing protein [Rhodocyclales bacterium]